MPHFTFTAPNGAGMSTDYVECINWDDLDSMAAAGVKFRVDGKVVSKQQLRQMYGSAVCTNTDGTAEETLSPQAVPSGLKSRQVRCIETGKIYETQSAAAKELGIDSAQVSDSIKTGRPRSGYTFERVQVIE